MAFTAMHYPVDKDQNQLHFWADNEELGITGDHFFDQFLTFDSGDAAGLSGESLDDPPSPSLVLDSIQNGLASSYSHHHSVWPPVGGNNYRAEEVAAGPTPLQQLIAIKPAITTTSSAVDSFNSDAAAAAEVLSPLAVADPDPVLSNGSISDSELLRLEGISLKSPSPQEISPKNATEPSSPVFATPVAPIPARKHNRFVETLYATIRRAAHRTTTTATKSPKQSHHHHNHHQQHHQPSLQPAHHLPPDDRFLGKHQTTTLGDFDVKLYDEARIAVKMEPKNCDALSIPPSLPGQAIYDPTAGFVTGHIDDPFVDDVLTLQAPPIIHPGARRASDAPPKTPSIKNEAFFHNEAMDPNNGPYTPIHRARRSPSSAEWPTEGLLTTNNEYNDNANIWHNNNGDLLSPMDWWEIRNATQSMSMSMSMQTQAQAQAQAQDNGMQMQYEYEADLSGLPMHTPRARQNSLLLNDPSNPVVSVSSSYPTLTPSHGHGGKGGGHPSDRRQRPRAPSSGARYIGAQTSPRKLLRHSHSLGYLREQESMSPSPRTGYPIVHPHPHPHPHPHVHPHSHSHHGNHHERRHQRSSSLTMRQQRSSTRRGEPRTPGARPRSNSRSGGGGASELNFVNFTPRDGDELMTGVAPSGSSKTKARREKLAMEKSKRISEVAIKAVQEIGGDVRKLMGDMGELFSDR
ncbi:hypothetical protein GGR50DRAFT_1499 [Xylaria sp. CBS 124048]|nr:hypothetical protein GGR50DRAFT_1499 [Xylaria sp. CBS 124048]